MLAMGVACGMTAGIAAGPTTGPATALTAVRFELSTDGRSLGSFSELVGISSTATATAVPAPSTDPIISLAPISGVFTVVLRRPMTRNLEMAAWHELVIIGDMDAARRSASFTAYAADGTPVARYHLTNAFPVKMEVTALRAGSSEVLMETVTLTCEFIQRVSV